MHWPIVILLSGAFQNISISWKLDRMSGYHDLNIQKEDQWQNYKVICLSTVMINILMFFDKS